VHLGRCGQSSGMQCPQKVFVMVFHESRATFATQFRNRPCGWDTHGGRYHGQIPHFVQQRFAWVLNFALNALQRIGLTARVLGWA
jgi:hypothetical protein